jgi:hypothetical protein
VDQPDEFSLFVDRFAFRAGLLLAAVGPGRLVGRRPRSGETLLMRLTRFSQTDPARDCCTFFAGGNIRAASNHRPGRVL